MTAEEIVSGQFKMIAGLVISVDPQENVIRINNIETKKPMTVKISADSSLKKLQPHVGAGDRQSFAWRGRRLGHREIDPRARPPVLQVALRPGRAAAPAVEGPAEPDAATCNR